MKRLATFTALVVLLTPFYATPTAAHPTGRCPQYEGLLARHSPGWSVSRMSGIMYRESRCNPSARSGTRDSGLLQINDINHPYLRRALGEHVDRWTLLNPGQNVRAAAALYRYSIRSGFSGYRPWAATA